MLLYACSLVLHRIVVHAHLGLPVRLPIAHQTEQLRAAFRGDSLLNLSELLVILLLILWSEMVENVNWLVLVLEVLLAVHHLGRHVSGLV